jgi:small neutral amino acid transporter SnatA (MarC family)
VDDYFRMVVSFFAIIDPIGNILVFQLLTEKSSGRERATVAGVVVLLAFGLIAVFTLAAGEILEFLDIGKASFQIAAVVLLVFVFVVLLASAVIRRYMPGRVVRAMARVIGVLLMAIAIDLIVVGLDAALLVSGV